jgi:DnaD/phage-associated family protein
LNKLLLDESPILVLPSLATKVGLNEAIFIQQLHYWLKDSNNTRDGFKWVYNTYEEWNEQFPFWSIRTLKRIITGLENNGYIISANYNQIKIDKTKWYRIDYEKLNELVARPSCQNGTSMVTDCPIESDNLAPPITIDYNIDYNIEKEEEEAPAQQVNPFQFFEENGFGVIGGYISEKIGSWCDDLSPELVLEAMKIAVEYGAKNWTYVERILRNWADKKYTSVEQVQAALLEFREKQAKQRDRPKYSSKPKRKELLPEWWDESPPYTGPPESKKPPEDNKAPRRDIDLKKQSFQEKLNKFRKGDHSGAT